MKTINEMKNTVLSVIQKNVNNDYLSEDLNEKVVVITGASKGIGLATANILYKQGAKLVLVSKNLKDLKKAFADFNTDKTLLISANVANEENVKDLVRKTNKKFGKIDVLINNAGVNIHKHLEETKLSEAEELLYTNILGPFLMCKHIIPIMKKHQSGTIINVGSKISRNAKVTPKKVLYATSKHALEGFSQALNNELKKYKIRVTCLMPGTVNTFITKKAMSYLSPYRVGEIIAMIIKFHDVDFENFVIKSVHQDI
ncbi:SDR family oxidoreductase [Patescibacteria group bacterium]